MPRALQRVQYCTEVKTEGEKRLVEILKEKFPGLTAVDVADISGMMSYKDQMNRGLILYSVSRWLWVHV